MSHTIVSAARHATVFAILALLTASCEDRVYETPQFGEFSYQGRVPDEPLHAAGADMDSSCFCPIGDGEWMTLGKPIESWYSLQDGKLQLMLRPVSLTEARQPSLLCQWVRHESFVASTSLDFTPRSDKMLAGLSVYRSANAHYVIGKTLDPVTGQPCVVLQRTLPAPQGSDTPLRRQTDTVARQTLRHQEANRALTLRVESRDGEYTFWYSTGGKLRQLGDSQATLPSPAPQDDAPRQLVVGIYATSAN